MTFRRLLRLLDNLEAFRDFYRFLEVFRDC